MGKNLTRLVIEGCLGVLSLRSVCECLSVKAVLYCNSDRVEVVIVVIVIITVNIFVIATITRLVVIITIATYL